MGSGFWTLSITIVQKAKKNYLLFIALLILKQSWKSAKSQKRHNKIIDMWKTSFSPHSFLFFRSFSLYFMSHSLLPLLIAHDDSFISMSIICLLISQTHSQFFVINAWCVCCRVIVCNSDDNENWEWDGSYMCEEEKKKFFEWVNDSLLCCCCWKCY